MGSASLPGLFGAFFAGLLSFLSPCVLPLIPVYLSFISGESLTEIREGGSGRMRLFFRSISFVLGFTVVFVLFFSVRAPVLSAVPPPASLCGLPEPLS